MTKMNLAAEECILTEKSKNLPPLKHIMALLTKGQNCSVSALHIIFSDFFKQNLLQLIIITTKLQNVNFFYS